MTIRLHISGIPSFLAGSDQLGLDFGDKAGGVNLWNWEDPNTSDPNNYGIVNAGLYDGDDNTIEYAAYSTVGDTISQVALGRRAFKDIEYLFKARVSGENAVGNVVGVKVYRVDPEAPYGNEVEIADLSTTIDENGKWYELSELYYSDVIDDNQRYKVVCYVEEGTGQPYGEAFAYFDYVRIDPNDFLTCDARLEYNFGSSGLARDFNNDCRVDLDDYVVIAENWQMTSPPEPMIKAVRAADEF